MYLHVDRHWTQPTEVIELYCRYQPYHHEISYLPMGIIRYDPSLII